MPDKVMIQSRAHIQIARIICSFIKNRNAMMNMTSLHLFFRQSPVFLGDGSIMSFVDFYDG